MKFTIALLFGIVATVAASGFGHYSGNSARERKVNYVNGERQAYVNRLAEKVGASSGLYRTYGVPGTGVGVGYTGYGGGYQKGGAYPGYNYPGSNYGSGYNKGNNYGGGYGDYAGQHDSGNCVNCEDPCVDC